jgi:superfamily II DNA or RNA helicase
MAAVRPRIRFVLQNRRAGVFAEDPETIKTLQCFFRYQPAGFERSRKYELGVWDGWIKMLKRGYVPTGLLLERWARLSQHFDLELEDQRKFPPFIALPEHLRENSRNFQLECLDRMIKASSTGGIILSATGSGKTLIAGLYSACLVGKLCFVVDELTILEQTREALGTLLKERIGLIGEGEFRPGRITIATSQSLHRHCERKDFVAWFKQLDVVIIDELHVALNDRTVEVLHTIKPKAVFGLTATLERSNREVRFQAAAIAGPVLYRYPIQRGQAEGYLEHGAALRVRVVQQGYNLRPQLAYKILVVESKPRNACVVELVKEGLKRGRTIVVLTERLKHLYRLSELLSGVPHKVLCGATEVKTRRAAQSDMETGETQLILTNRIFRKSVNITRLDTVIDCAAGRDRNAVIQGFGRGVRLNQNKRGFIYFDISDAAPAHAPGCNPLAAHSVDRWAALRELDIPIDSVVWRNNASDIWQKAEELLSQLLRKRCLEENSK